MSDLKATIGPSGNVASSHIVACSFSDGGNGILIRCGILASRLSGETLRGRCVKTFLLSGIAGKIHELLRGDLALSEQLCVASVVARSPNFWTLCLVKLFSLNKLIAAIDFAHASLLHSGSFRVNFLIRPSLCPGIGHRSFVSFLVGLMTAGVLCALKLDATLLLSAMLLLQQALKLFNSMPQRLILVHADRDLLYCANDMFFSLAA